MSGPSYFVRKGVSAAAQACGADPFTGAVIGRVASTASSMVFHDHHTHFHTDPDEAAALAGAAVETVSDSSDLDDAVDVSDHLRSGTSEQDLSLAGIKPGTHVDVDHGSYQHGATVASDPNTNSTYWSGHNVGDKDVYVKPDYPNPHAAAGEWVDSSMLTKD